MQKLKITSHLLATTLVPANKNFSLLIYIAALIHFDITSKILFSLYMILGFNLVELISINSRIDKLG